MICPEMENGGEGGIRTPDSLATIPVFETGAFNRSATSPQYDRCLVDVRGTLAGLTDSEKSNFTLFFKPLLWSPHGVAVQGVKNMRQSAK